MASLSSISINRPVLAIVMSIVIILFGVIGFGFLGVREYPSVDPPVISVSTNYQGANADIIESQITEPLEESINGIAGIKNLTSVSRDGRSTVTVEFDLNVDLEAAANDVRDRVSSAQRSLPPDCDPPIVRKADADSGPIIFFNIKSSERNLLDLTRIAETTFKERVQTIPGVSSVMVWGSKRYSMRLWMDPDKLAAYRLTPLDVLNAVNRENVELPTGLVEGQNTELTVRTTGRLQTPAEFNDMIIKEDDNGTVKFRDIGNAELAPENLRTVLKRDGVPMVGLAIVPQPGSNNIEIADAFYKRIESIKKDLPADIELGVGFDNTRYIRDSIAEVQQTIFVAFALVVGIIFLFLRDWRTTFIPMVTIPISLVGTFFIMYIAGFSINVLTMLGIVLAIGLVVDDTIVVLENIYSKIEQGMKPVEAGLKGVTEIFFAVISTTVSLVAVFLPLLFLQGLTGKLFIEFGIVVAGAVVISSFVALTLTPMLSTRMLKKRERQQWVYRVTEPFFIWLNEGYNRSLDTFIQYKYVSFIAILLCGGGIYWLMGLLPTEMAPKEDRNGFRIIASGPEGATFEYMDDYVDDVVAKALDEIPELEAIISVTSPGFGASSSVNSAFMFTILADADKRERSQSDIANAFRPTVSADTRARAFIAEPQTLSASRSRVDLEYVIQAPNLEKLKEILPEFMGKAFDSDKFGFVDLNLKFNRPEVKIEINREKARTMGVTVRDIAETLQLAFSGRRFGYFIMDGKQYQVIGQVTREDRNEPLDLASLYVKNSNGNLVQLDNLVSLSEQSTPPQLYRFNRYVSATVSAIMAEGQTVSKGIEEMDRIKAEVLDETFSTALAGSAQEYSESSSSLVFAFIFALVLIYLILAAQFESFVDPIIIMLTVPLALFGALISLHLFGESLNIFSEIGIIMLIGLVSKNGILIVEFANQRKAQDMDLLEAISGAAKARFRPILMTSLSTTLGILPIALALGAGSESRVSMGIAVIGGLIFSTLLTLYIIPATYAVLSGKSKRMARA